MYIHILLHTIYIKYYILYLRSLAAGTVAQERETGLGAGTSLFSPSFVLSVVEGLGFRV